MSEPLRRPGENRCRPAVDVSVVEHPAKLRRITELRFAGWTVHVDGAAVTVPSQDITGKAIEDLGYCLHKAYVLAEVRIGSRLPALEPALVPELIATLQHARRIAASCWAAHSHDVYHCTRQAWEQDGMAVPYAALIRALRAALPQRTTLIDYTDHADLPQICQLYARAVALIGADSQRGAA
jgi:hypothetical protein